ncbi:MAG TPA: acyltransferase [Verrucomicrobiae bacterium]|nr:acyltransferase [Verrucomicrobiae bacterium]
MDSPKANWLDAWHVNPSANKDYDLLDGLRGVAILLVVACHLLYVNPLFNPVVVFIGNVFSAGFWGVRVFFTLSGLLISWPFWKRKVKGATRLTPPGYGWRRFWKIYPPLALSVLVLTPIYMIRTHDASFPGIALRWLVGLPLVIPVSGKLNPVMWSLVVEAQFYIVLPLLFLCLKRVPARACVWTISLVFLVVPTGWRWFWLTKGISMTLYPELNVHFPSALDAFSFGILLGGLESLGMLRKSWAKLGDLGFVLLIVSLLATAWFKIHPILAAPLQEEVLGWPVKVASGLLLCYIADPQHPRSRMLSQPWLRWCGLISYEWYLFHQPIFTWTYDLCGPSHGNILRYLAIQTISLPLGLIVAVLVYRCFSLPILRYGRGRNTHPAESTLKRVPSAANP